jgi:AcrR family transcriptional regulator
MIARREKTTAEKIASTALQVLEREGPSAVSMRRIAAAIDVTPVAIYHHFPSREALLQAVTDQEFAKLLDFIAARRQKADPKSSATKLLIELMEGISTMR